MRTYWLLGKEGFVFKIEKEVCAYIPKKKQKKAVAPTAAAAVLDSPVLARVISVGEETTIVATPPPPQTGLPTPVPPGGGESQDGSVADPWSSSLYQSALSFSFFVANSYFSREGKETAWILWLPCDPF